VVVSLLAVIVPRPAPAQFARHYAAFAVGATYSDLTDYLFTLGWRWGGTAGLMVGVVAFEHSYLELAPSWTRVGGGEIRLDNLDIPVLLGGILPLAGPDNLIRLYGGISLAVRIGCEAGEWAACDLARGTTWSVPMGVSLIRVVRNGDFAGVDARYVLGFSDVFDVTDATQRSWQFRAMFGITLRRE
jgi:hypothetical protein